LEPKEFKIWLARWLKERVVFSTDDANEINIAISVPDRVIAVNLGNCILRFAVEFAIAKENQELQLAVSFVDDQIINYKNKIKNLTDEILAIRSSSSSGGNVLSLSGFYDSGVGLVKKEVDESRVVLEENIKVAESIINAPGKSWNNQALVAQLGSANDLLNVKIKALQSDLNKRSVEKNSILKSINYIESISRELQLYGQSYQKLQEQKFSLAMVRETIPARFQILLGSDIADVRPSIRGLLAVALGSIFGGVLGLIVLILRDKVDPRVRDKYSLSFAEGAMVLSFPKIDTESGAGFTHFNRQLVPNFNFGNQLTIGLKQLRQSVLNFLKSKDPVSSDIKSAKTIILTGALEGSGKSTLSAGLAWSLVEAGYSTLLIDIDQYKSQTSNHFNLLGQKGLTDLLALETPVNALNVLNFVKCFSSTTAQNKRGDLAILPIGTGKIDFSYFDEIRFIKMIEFLKSQYDFIVVDSSPILQTFELIGSFTNADLIFLVAKFNETRVKNLREVVELLPSSLSSKIGFLINYSFETRNVSRFGNYYNLTDSAQTHVARSRKAA
jgi:Mrp family chromosome partitioning ATPase